MACSISRSAADPARARGRRHLLLALAAGAPVAAWAQSLTSVEARLDVPSRGPASVSLALRFDSVRGGRVRFSLNAPSVRSVAERVRGCDGAPASDREVRLDGTLFPALQSELPGGCSEIELSYRVDDPSRIPLFVPEERLAPGAAVALEVKTGGRLAGRTFPRLSWQDDGVGRRRLRQVPALVILPVSRRAAVPSGGPPHGPDPNGPGFGWTLWGFLVGAILFLAGFFIWARLTAEREARQSVAPPASPGDR